MTISQSKEPTNGQIISQAFIIQIAQKLVATTNLPPPSSIFHAQTNTTPTF
jgi:hypothetical protein